MNFNPEIFKAYDIRGVYGQDLDWEFAFRLGAALVRYINKKSFLVAYDDRSFSRELADSLGKGMISAGADVQYLGLATTPLFNFVFTKLGVNGGVMVTASHLGPEYAGFKVFGEGGAIIGGDSGLEQIESILTEDKNPEAPKYGGKIIEQDRPKLIKEYINFIIKEAGWNSSYSRVEKVKIKFPTAAQDEIGELFNKSGLQESEWALDISFELDNDADRIYVFNSLGQPVRADHITALLVQDEVRFWRKPKVIYDFRFSKGVLEKFASWGVRAIRSKTGRAFMRESMAGHGADIGGEISGHIYFKEANYNEMPLLTMLRLLKIIKKSEKSIDELVEPFKTRFNSGEINIATGGLGQGVGEIIEKLKNKYHDGKIDELDGLTIEYSDPVDDGASWWFNLRPSNTEPLVRLVVEAKTKNLLDEKVIEIRGLLN